MRMKPSVPNCFAYLADSSPRDFTGILRSCRCQKLGGRWQSSRSAGGHGRASDGETQHLQPLSCLDPMPGWPGKIESKSFFYYTSAFHSDIYYCGIALQAALMDLVKEIDSEMGGAGGEADPKGKGKNGTLDVYEVQQLLKKVRGQNILFS